MINTQINKSLLLISNTLLSIKKNQGDCLYSTKALLQDESNKKYTKKKKRNILEPYMSNLILVNKTLKTIVPQCKFFFYQITD